MKDERLASIRSLSDFDAFDGFVFVTDKATHKVVYENEAYRKLRDNAPSSFPTFDDRFLSLRFYPLSLKGHDYIVQIARSIPSYHELVDTHPTRVAVDDIENIVRTEMQSQALYASDGRSYHESLTDRIIRRAMEFYGSPLAQHTQFPHKEGVNPNVTHYVDDGTRHTRDIAVDAFADEYFNSFFKHGYSLLAEDIRDFALVGDGLAETFLSLGVQWLLSIPYFTEGRLSGILTLANPGEDKPSDDFFFADFATNSVGLMSYRGELYAKMYLDDITSFPWTSAIGSFYGDYIAAHPDIPIVIFEFDFLHFRMLTRTYGTRIGDDILRKTGELLREKFPSSILTRQNGSDTFIVVTTGIADSIAISAQRIASDIQAAFPNIMMTLTFGIYQVKDTDEDLDYSILKASFAHRYAKDNPLDRIKIFDDTMDRKETLAVRFANNFRKSLQNGDFLVYIQPKFNLETESYFGGEALVRWKLGNEMVPPGDFIPQFEANGLCRDLDLYVLRKSCQIIKDWLKNDPDNAVPLSVNFSRVDFADPRLFESVLFVIKEEDIPPSFIEIEITESAYVDYQEQIISFIRKCHASGIKVLMDDFGAGISSFNSLKNLDIDAIKLDYGFLSEEGDNRKKRKIIEGIVALARAIRIPVIIEGIETKAEAAFFRSLGVQYAQGYLFGKPMPLPQFEEIRNRVHETMFETGDDHRQMLQELLDTNSNLNFIFMRINMLSGVFRFDGETLCPVLANERLEQAFTTIGNPSDFLRADLLSFFSKEKRQTVLECLRAEHNYYVFSEKKAYEFHIADRIIPIYMQGLLIQTDPDGNRYFLLTAEYFGSREGSSPIQDDSLSWLLSSHIQGCAILDLDGKILAHNDFLKEYYPNLSVGMDAEAIFCHRFGDDINVHRAYLPSRELVFDVSSRPTVYKGKEATLLIFSKLGDPGSYIAEIGGDGFKYYDRLISTVHTIAVCYVEIDLEGDSFFQINFKDHDDFAYHDAVTHGSYTGDLYQRFLASVAPSELGEIRAAMRLDKLVEACKSLSPFTLDYKLNDGTYHRLHMRFHFDGSHHFACFFLEDITVERLRDFDPLTKCFGRPVGVATIDHYIAKHPLDKMAFFILDIDGFKTLNDTYGHPLGDKVLAEMHDAFASLHPDYDFGTRMGGDEFCILLTDRGSDFDPDKERERIVSSLRNIGYQVGLNKPINASIGCALIPEDGGTVSTVYPKADSDLYEQKKIRKGER